MRHRAAKHPDDRNEGQAGDGRKNEPIELQLADVLDEVILGRQQQDAAAISFTKGEFCQPEQIAVSVVIMDNAFVSVEVVRPSQDGGHEPGIDLVDAG